MLKNFGIKKGDVVLIHMPNMPEAVYTMLACARIGAVHSYVFGGFSAAELANRIKDSQPKLILSTNVGTIKTKFRYNFKIIKIFIKKIF